MLRLVALTIGALLVSVSRVSAHDSGFGIARYLPDGHLDQAFGSNGVVVTRAAQRSLVANILVLQPDGKILIGGMVAELTSASLQLALARYTADGSPDAEFGTEGSVSTPVPPGGAQANAIVLQADGKILVAGTAFGQGAEDDRFLLARYSSTGRPDPGFGADGVVTTHVGLGAASVQAVTLQPDGRIVAVGTAYANGATDDDFAVARYTVDGALDTTFGSGGVVTTDFGAAEPSAGSASLDRGSAVVVQPDGMILVAGSQHGSAQAVVAARYTPDGRLDPTFGVGGKARASAPDAQVFGLMVQADGRLLVSGTVRTVSGGSTAPFAMFRFLPGGQPDSSFGTDGLVTATFEGSRSGARALVVQPDGRLVSAGAKFGAPSAQGDALPQSGFALTRYTADGQVDATFGAGGRVATSMGDAGALPLALVVQPDGKILAAGLVFFQIVAPPAADAANPFRAATRIAAPASGVALLGAALAVSLVVRRARR